MEIKNISIVSEGDKIYKKYNVKIDKKEDIILYSCDEWGIRFEPYNGNFTDKEFDLITEQLFEDAYYNKNFSKF